MIYDEVDQFTGAGRTLWKNDCNTIVIPVNTVGVMGRGVAKEAAQRYKGLLHEYRKACFDGRLTINSLYVYKAHDGVNILCFPTKKHWRDPSRLEWIDHNLKLLAETYEELGIDSIAIPRIGCGLGGLSWVNDVCPLVYKHLDPIEPPVLIFI